MLYPFFSLISRLPGLTLTVLTSVLFIVPPILANETDQDMPVSAVGGAVHADLFTGTATTSIPIAVPPGRGGVQPNLALVYNSANGNGWVGLGWKLEKSVIERQTKFGLNYSGDEYIFRLSGINVELVNVGSNQYRAKIEGSFTRVQKLTASDGKPYFLATDKTGRKFYFGRTAATRVAHPSDATKIFRWCLDRVEDLDGNYMTISYTGDQGQGYLSRIDYTGHGSTRPTNSVLFHLETRTDAVPMYTSHFLMKTAKRLKTVEVRANNRIVLAYKLTYTSSAGTSRSLLRSVTQYGKDATIRSGSITGGSRLPPVTMHYGGETSAGNWQTATALNPPASIAADGRSDQGTRFVELNGDGRLDFVYHSSATTKGAYLNTGSGWRSTPGYVPPYDIVTTSGQDRGARFVELNGDGRIDFVYRSSATTKGAYLNTGSGWRSTPGYVPPYDIATTSGQDRGARFVELNGDGRKDLAYRSSATTKGAYLNTGTGWRSAAAFAPPANVVVNAKDQGARFVDLNGDGRQDFVYRTSSTTKGAYLNTGTGWQSTPAFTPPSEIVATNGKDAGTRFVDLNGDGLADFLYRSSATTKGASLNTGTGWQSTPAFAPPADIVANAKDQGARFVDLNGDGLTDFVYRTSNTTKGAYLNTGTGWVSASAFAPPYEIATDGKDQGARFVDLNGDGRVDFLYHRRITSSNKPKGAWLNTNTPVLLKTLTNGLGATTTLTYKPSTQYANTQLPYPTQTVAAITTNDGNGNVAATAYTYAGGYHHIGEREFRGFHYAKVTGPAGPSGEKTITETWFHQGNDLAVGTNNPAVAHGYLKGAPYRVKVTDARGNRYSETTTTYTADANGQAPFFTPPASVVIKTCDGNATCRTTRTDYTYDAYGNVTQERQYGDTATTTDDRTVVRTFAANTTKWIVTLPTRETIRAGIGTTGTELARTDFYYDGTTGCATASTNQTPAKGHLTRSVR